MWVLDLFCGQGGAGMGYYCAGFDVVGIDQADQPRYPFEFWQADALDYVATADLSGFDLIHASPPCQRYSQISKINKRSYHPDLIAPMRNALMATGIPYVIENVPGSPLIDPVRLCGTEFDLKTIWPGNGEVWLRRHRLFETSFPLERPKGCACRDKAIVGVYGGGTWGKLRGLGYEQAKSEVMGIDWMTRTGLNQAIPPAYTEYIGYYFDLHFGLNRTYDY
jgi:DNA (cytosine-5)-methyltransferase 1